MSTELDLLIEHQENKFQHKEYMRGLGAVNPYTALLTSGQSYLDKHPEDAEALLKIVQKLNAYTNTDPYGHKERQAVSYLNSALADDLYVHGIIANYNNAMNSGQPDIKRDASEITFSPDGRVSGIHSSTSHNMPKPEELIINPIKDAAERFYQNNPNYPMYQQSLER